MVNVIMYDEESTLAREAQLIFSNVQGFNMSDTLRVWRGKVKAGNPNNQEYEFEFIFPHGFPKQRPIVKAITPIAHNNVTNDGYVELDILDRWRPEFHGYQVLLQLISLLKRSPPSLDAGYSSRTQQPSTQRGSIPASSNRMNSSIQPRPNPPTKNKFENFRKASGSQVGVTSRGSTPLSPAQQQEAQDSAILKKQLAEIREQMTKQEEELSRMRARDAIGIGSSSQSEHQKQLSDSFKHLKPDDQVAEIESEQIAISEMMAGLQEKHQSGEISIFDYSKLYKKYSRDLFILRKKLEYIKEKQ